MDSFELNKIAGAVSARSCSWSASTSSQAASSRRRSPACRATTFPSPQQETAGGGRQAAGAGRAAASAPGERRPGQGPERGQEMRRLPHLRQGRPEQGRPEPLRRRRPPRRLARRASTTRPRSRPRAATGPTKSSTSSSRTRRRPCPARSWPSPACPGQERADILAYLRTPLRQPGAAADAMSGRRDTVVLLTVARPKPTTMFATQ